MVLRDMQCQCTTEQLKQSRLRNSWRYVHKQPVEYKFMHAYIYIELVLICQLTFEHEITNFFCHTDVQYLLEQSCRIIWYHQHKRDI